MQIALVINGLLAQITHKNYDVLVNSLGRNASCKYENDICTKLHRYQVVRGAMKSSLREMYFQRNPTQSFTQLMFVQVLKTKGESHVHARQMKFLHDKMLY